MGTPTSLPGSKLSWLYRVAERCCFDQLARRKSRPETAMEHVNDGPAREAALSPDAAAALEDREVIMRFLDRFDDDRIKQVALHHFLDEMTQEEIAAATGWSRLTVARKIELLRERAAALRALLCGGNAA